MKSTPTPRFAIQRLFLLTLVCSVAVAALVSIVASASRAKRSARARAEAANTKSGITIGQNSGDKSQPLAPSAANITATLTDNTASATKVAPGGTINYTAVITNTNVNSPADDATNLNFSAPLDANTTLTAGSVHASPLAFNDTYNWIGNTVLNSTTPGPGVAAFPAVTANDVAVNAPGGTDTFTLTAIAGGATTLGGVVTLAANGSFTYTPPLNRPGGADPASVTDTFTYTITNNADGALTSTGTVSIVLTNRVFYLQAGAAGDGRSNTPSSDLATISTNANRATDIFYIFSNAGSLAGLFTVDAGQQLLGQGINLVVNIPVIGSTTLFSAAAPTPTTTNGAGNCVTLAGAPGNNTLSGFNIGNCTGTAIFGAVNVGTLTINNLSINTTGGGLDLTGSANPVVSITLGSLTARNVNLASLGGTISLAGGALNNATANAFSVNGGVATITYSGTISNSVGKQVNIINMTGGSVSLSGAISGTGTGINLVTNTGATINFTGGIALSTGVNAAFVATGGGTVNATQNNTTILNTVSTTTGTGVNIQTPTIIGASGVTFRSVTVNNGASNSATNGIILNGTTGTFLVSGDASQTGGFFDRDGSGGTLNRTTGHSVLLTNAQNVTLRQMNITNTAAGGACPANCTADAVHSTTGANIVLSAVTLQNLGGNGWNAANITGTNAINNNSLISTWNTNTTNGVTVANTTTNFSGSFTVDRCTFTTSATGAVGFLFDVDTNAGNGTVTVTNSEFTLIDQNAVQINNDGPGILNAIVQKNNFHDADATGGDGNNTLFLALSGSGRLNFTIGGPVAGDGNTFTNLARLSANAGVCQVNAAGGTASTGAKLNGTIQNNTLTNPGFVSQRRGIMVAAEASSGNHGGHAVLIGNNSVQNFQLHGIYVSMTTINGATSANDNLNNNITISNNQVGNISPVGQGGGDSGSAIEFETNNGNAGVGSDISANLLLQNNTAVSNNSSGIGDTVDISSLGNVAPNTSVIHVTALGNSLTQSNVGGQVFEARTVLDSAASMCLDLNAGNTSPNTAIGGNGTGFRVTQDAGSGTYSIDGMAAGAQTAANVDTFLTARNTGAVTVAGSFVGAPGGCNNATLPTAPSPVGNQITINQTGVMKTDSATSAVVQGSVAKTTTPATTINDVSSKAGISSVTAKAAPKASAAEVARIYRSERTLSHHAVSSRLKAFSQDPNAPTAGEIVTLNTIPTFPAAKSITIKYSATVNTTALTARQATTQGTVTANGGAISVTTTDPGPPVVAGPTVTLLDTTLTWTGATDTNWNIATNWNRPGPAVSSYAPGVGNSAVNDVVIPAVATQPTIGTTPISIYSLNLANTMTLTITNPGTLTIEGAGTGSDLTLNGIISGGNLNFGAGTHAISGAGSLSSTNVATILTGSTVTLNNALRAGALAVNAGGSLIITGQTVSLNGSGAALAVGGTFTTTGSTVVLDGTAAQTIAGTTYNNLTINNTIGAHVTGVTLTGNAIVNGVLTLTSSDLATGSFTLTMPNTATSAPASGASDVVGNVTRTGFASGGIALSFGNPLNTIRINSGTAPTSINVLLAKNAPVTYAAAALRSYTITPTGGTGITATVRLHYRQVDLANPLAPGGSVSETPTVDFNFRRFFGGGWKAVVPTSRNVGVVEDNWLESNAVTDFSEWTFANLTPTATSGVITGRIVDNDGHPVEGAVVRLDGTQNRKFITDANGVYRFENVETNGFYTVTPSRANYTFSPATRSFSQVGESTEAAFSATAAAGNYLNPLDTPEYFVRQHYLDFLGREPDESGFNFWSDEIIGCGLDQDCIGRKRENVSAAYFLSIEFQATGGLVDGLYRAGFGVRPAFAQFMPDTRAIAAGVVVGRDGWQAKLQANKEAFVADFVNRPAFHALYDGMENSVFVDTLISHTGVSFTAGERDALVSGLSAGTMTRAEALTAIAENGGFKSAKFNDAFVMMEYFGYLRRDADAEGFQYWLNKLNQFGGNFEQAEMVRAFIVSGEYRDRFPK